MSCSVFPLIAIAPYKHRLKLATSKRVFAPGFSLVELMVVVAIATILVGLAVPSFTEMIRNNRLAGASSALQVSLSLARSEAIKRGSDAVVTVAANDATGSWNQGWTVFVDKTADAHAGIGPTTDDSSAAGWTRLEVATAPSASISADQTSDLTYFSFNGQGRVVDASGGAGQRSFWFFDGASQKYCLIVSNTGRVRTERVDSSASCSLA